MNDPIFFYLKRRASPGCPRLSNMGKEIGVVSWFYPQDKMHPLLLELGKVRRVGTEGILGNDKGQTRVILTQLGQKTFGSVAFAVVFLLAVLSDDRLWRQGNDCFLL